jgi:hypothetical protein
MFTIAKMAVPLPLPLLLLLLIPSLSALAQSQDLPYYYNFTGYTQFIDASSQLASANVSLSLTFKFCQTDGVLVYASNTNLQRLHYFTVGIYRSQPFVEFDLGSDLREITVAATLLKNTWYTLDFHNFSAGSEGLTVTLDNRTTPFSTDPFNGFDFASLDGPLFIGGHPSPQQIEVQLPSDHEYC